MSYNLDDLTTLGQWAERIGATGARIQQWMTSENAPKPVKTYGKVRLFLISDLRQLTELKGSAADLMGFGYISPEVHEGLIADLKYYNELLLDRDEAIAALQGKLAKAQTYSEFDIEG